jgi:hypothetical protein
MVNEESQSCVMSVDFLQDQKHLVSSTIEGIINVTSLETQKIMATTNTMENVTTMDSNSICCVRKIRNHALGTNVFMFGSEAQQV